MVVYDRDDKDLLRIKEVKLHYVYKETPYNITKGAVGLFIIELIQKTLKGQEQNKELFNYIFQLLTFLDQSQELINNVHLHFLLEYSNYLGFAPSGLFEESNPYFDMEQGKFAFSKQNKYVLPENLSRIVSDLLHLDLEECHHLKIHSKERMELLKSLILFYKLHIDNFPEINSHKVLKQVFA